MKIPHDNFNYFFAPLVGDELAVYGLQARLAFDLRNRASIADPYDTLEKSLLSEIQESVEFHETQPGVSGTEARRWKSIGANGALGGRLTLAALRTVGDIYVNETSVPQELPSVEANTRTVLRHVYGAAFGGKLVGFANLVALGRGVNPRSPMIAPIALLEKMARTPAYRVFNTGSFKSELDETGQLEIQPRYKRLSKILNKQCPATYAKVRFAERTRPALLTFMQTVGDVAIDEIFPNQFGIVRK